MCTAFTLDLRKLGAVRVECVDELAVVLESCRRRDALLLREPREVHAAPEWSDRDVCFVA